MHEKNIIHRDIHSENIIFNQKTNELKLIDFGVAKVAFEDNLNLSANGKKKY